MKRNTNLRGDKATLSFMFPVTNGVMGGVQQILMILIPYLAKENVANVRLYDYPNGLIKRKLLESDPNLDIEIINLDRNALLISNKGDEVFIWFGMQFMQCGHFLKNHNGVRILNWNVYYPQLRYMVRLKGIKVPLVESEIYKLLYINNAQIFMEEAGRQLLCRAGRCLDKGTIVPVPFLNEDKSLKKERVSTSEIVIAYIGRAVKWKVFPLIKLLDDLSILPGSFKVVVFTDNKIFYEKTLPFYKNIKVDIYEGKVGEDLANCLETENIDLGFSMGMSALTLASYGIPTLMADFSNEVFPKEYNYKWIFDVEIGNLGHEIGSEFFNEDDRKPLVSILDELNSSYNILSEKSSSYVSRNYSVKRVVDSLILNVERTTLSPKKIKFRWFLLKGFFSILKDKFSTSQKKQLGIWSK